jgi:hypothetical protein
MRERLRDGCTGRTSVSCIRFALESLRGPGYKLLAWNQTPLWTLNPPLCAEP